jgi:hypothetical protein
MKTVKFNFQFIVTSFFVLSTFYILIYNILHYAPILGYDGEAHFSYVNSLARYLPRQLRLPSSDETREFFSPPLGYLVPAVSQVVCRNLINSSNFLMDCQPIFGKSTQIIQSLLYVFTININLVTLKKITNSKTLINLPYLILVSLLAVNYRTISMVRGEPYILFFLSLFILAIVKVERANFVIQPKNILLTGLIIGCLALSRQWAFFLFIPILIIAFFGKLDSKSAHFKFWAFSSGFGALLSSWFYIGLYLNYGSFTTFNLSKPKFSFSNQSFEFYIPNFDQIKYLFTKPIRPYLENQFITTLYADTWGDYWGYFSFTSRFLQIGRNQLEIGDYFAKVNVISLITTGIICFFCYKTYTNFKNIYLIKYIFLAMLCSILGFLLWVISFPVANGVIIKSSYIIQFFNLAVFSASVSFYKLQFVNRKLYIILISLLTVIFIHNFQTFLSHFPINYYP